MPLHRRIVAENRPTGLYSLDLARKFDALILTIDVRSKDIWRKLELGKPSHENNGND